MARIDAVLRRAYGNVPEDAETWARLFGEWLFTEEVRIKHIEKAIKNALYGNGTH